MDVKRLGLILLSPALDKWMQTIYKLHNLNVLSRSNGMYKTASHSTMAHRAHSMTFHGHANVINSLYAGMVMCCCTKKISEQILDTTLNCIAQLVLCAACFFLLHLHLVAIIFFELNIKNRPRLYENFNWNWNDLMHFNRLEIPSKIHGK